MKAKTLIITLILAAVILVPLAIAATDNAPDGPRGGRRAGGVPPGGAQVREGSGQRGHARGRSEDPRRAHRGHRAVPARARLHGA